MSDMDDIIRLDARLAMLKALAAQPDGRLNSRLLCDDLRERWGISKPIVWVREELRELEQLGAVKIEKDLPPLTIVRLTEKGRDHVERRIVITGVRRPSDD